MANFAPTGTAVDLLIGERNPRGIPATVFIENIDEFIVRAATPEGKIEPIIGAMNELYSKYKFMEVHTTKSKANMKAKLPDIRKTLDTVTFLANKKGDEPLITTFNIADNVYAKATIGNTDTVCLWLGANVMLQYTYDEALEMLTSSLANAIEKQRTIQEDLDFLRDQIITTEVNIARLFNHDVRKRRMEAESGTTEEVSEEKKED